MPLYIAHIRKSDHAVQSLSQHLLAVSTLTEGFAHKAGLPLTGRLLGLMHDFGKYSAAFQAYIKSAIGLLDQDNDEYLDPAASKGKIDHSTAGAQLTWEHFTRYGRISLHYAQMLALVVCSHHSGLADCLSPLGEDTFVRRMAKPDDKTHTLECASKADLSVQEAVRALLDKTLLLEMQQRCDSIRKKEHEAGAHATTREEQYDHKNAAPFKLGLLTRFLLSCLLDADRIDSAEFENPDYADLRERLGSPNWRVLSSRLDERLAELPKTDPIHTIRQEVSDHCAARAHAPPGIFTLTVPTGGGKTLASLRFALAHAEKHGLERIIYVIPYTSIIDQNADVARAFLERGEEPGTVVLEQHSNLQPEKESWQGKLLASNWESPVVFTTMVQFLETLFGSGARCARRMHTLARSVLIFDEIQTLPLPCMHMFCHALNFLVDECGSSAVLCTATQPLLDRLPKPFRGQLHVKPDAELMPDVRELFDKLQRVSFVNHCRTPMQAQDIAELAQQEVRATGSCLIVANTKSWAERLYRLCARPDLRVFYLSTNLCPAHRMAILQDIHALLGHEPVLCVSTQLIECGVDISFGSVIRFAAGLDSILQAAGRCNRHKERASGRVHVVTVPEGQEHLDSLESIKEGRSAFLRLVHEGSPLMREAGDDLSRPDIIHRYFEYFFHQQASHMTYPVTGTSGQNGTLWRMLGVNDINPGQMPDLRMLRQSFASANRLFKPIDTASQGILVPYNRGKELIAELYSNSHRTRQRAILHEAQRHTVNVYQNVLNMLINADALRSQCETGLYCLREEYYDSTLGVVTQPSGDPSVLLL